MFVNLELLQAKASSLGVDLGELLENPHLSFEEVLTLIMSSLPKANHVPAEKAEPLGDENSSQSNPEPETQQACTSRKAPCLQIQEIPKPLQLFTEKPPSEEQSRIVRTQERDAPEKTKIFPPRLISNAPAPHPFTQETVSPDNPPQPDTDPNLNLRTSQLPPIEHTGTKSKLTQPESENSSNTYEKPKPLPSAGERGKLFPAETQAPRKSAVKTEPLKHLREPIKTFTHEQRYAEEQKDKEDFLLVKKTADAVKKEPLNLPEKKEIKIPRRIETNPDTHPKPTKPLLGKKPTKSTTVHVQEVSSAEFEPKRHATDAQTDLQRETSPQPSQEKPPQRQPEPLRTSPATAENTQAKTRENAPSERLSQNPDKTELTPRTELTPEDGEIFLDKQPNQPIRPEEVSRPVPKRELTENTKAQAPKPENGEHRPELNLKPKDTVFEETPQTQETYQREATLPPKQEVKHIRLRFEDAHIRFRFQSANVQVEVNLKEDLQRHLTYLDIQRLTKSLENLGLSLEGFKVNGMELVGRNSRGPKREDKERFNIKDRDEIPEKANGSTSYSPDFNLLL